MNTEKFTGSAKATGHAQQTSSETEDKLPEPLAPLFNPASINFLDTNLKMNVSFGIKGIKMRTPKTIQLLVP